MWKYENGEVPELLVSSIKNKVKSFLFRQRWRKANKHNKTYVKTVFNADLVHIGNHTYGCIDPQLSNSNAKLQIGHFCSIAGNVKFLVSAEHPIDRISTYPFRANLFYGEPEAETKGDIIVEDDVWIGNNATILSGVRIGQVAVVAAGAVVNKDVPPYAVVGGVPAKVIKYRFSPELIGALLEVDFSVLDPEQLRLHEQALYEPLQDVQQLHWLPKRKG